MLFESYLVIASIGISNPVTDEQSTTETYFVGVSGERQ